MAAGEPTTPPLPSAQGLQLKDSVAQFSHSMTAQTDLRVEAVHLARFAANFAQVAGSVVIPSPVPGEGGLSLPSAYNKSRGAAAS